MELIRQNRLSEAMLLLEKICEDYSNDCEARSLLGVVQGKIGLHEKAVASLRIALEFRPDSVPTLKNLIVSLWNVNRVDEVLACCERLVQLAPHDLDNRANLSTLLSRKCYYGKAVEQYREILRQRSGYPGILLNLGGALSGQGKSDEALQVYQEALRRNPKDKGVFSNLLLEMQYATGQTPAAQYAAHKEWGERFRDVTCCPVAFSNEPDPDRRLRIGYVSPDFRTHSVAYFFEPLLQYCNKETFETYCYSETIIRDVTTVRLQGLADHWVEIRQLDDQQVAARIVEDGIDILVDLSGHTAGNRLGVFLKKPAPIQVTYLGYPNTTGLPNMDYRLTDITADPLGMEKFHTEELVRLPDCFLCYQPPVEAPEVGPLPALANGFVTFGCFNNLSKIKSVAVGLWAELLHETPHSRLLIKNFSLTDPESRARYLELFLERGVEAGRIEFSGAVQDTACHLAYYNRVDIALDTFPYNGTATTCEALWMGVPVISLVGDLHVGRVGKSLLSCVGLKDLVAESPREYLAICLSLAGDLGRLGRIRATLREQMRTSCLLDGSRFMANLEKSYRYCWGKWCQEKG